jgi:NADH-quinone oxidoreductase subunit L
MNPSIPWVILFAPLVSTAAIVLLTHRARGLSAGISVGSAVLTFLLALIVFASAAPAEPLRFFWLDFGPRFQVPIGLTIDRLSKAMLLVVTGIGSLIHIYSLGYMQEDEGKSRYFAGLSLFMFSMTGIVLSDNFVMMFVFWELVGVSSYILIGHWYFRPSAAAAANKAFITNRIGDFGFMLGILMLWFSAGTFLFDGLKNDLGSLAANPAYLTTATLLVFCGAVGKSAQVPLHVWLPDAMEGPTPVSALIHAATMVAAGVYMLARVFFLVEASPDAQQVIAWVGTITAVLAALMATQQDDIKRVLAYSTLSQLGYMIMAIGVAAGAAAMFHLFTHACFKALLFLGAGAVIHSLHHEQDMWKMGALMRSMPSTFMTFLIGTLALTGFPGLSGFFSKDAILVAAHERNGWIFALALGTAFLTAFYMFRLFCVVFFGSAKSEAAMHAREAPAVMKVPLWILAALSVIAGYGFFAGHILDLPHGEAHGWTVPLLAGLAFVLGTGAAVALYHRRDKDPIRIPLFANRFYIDDLYGTLIRYTNDLLASLSGWFDRWIIDGVMVRGLGGMARGAGFVLSFLQVGNLQAYAFLFGVGVVALIFFVVLQ